MVEVIVLAVLVVVYGLREKIRKSLDDLRDEYR
jgi:hypothetical protein